VAIHPPGRVFTWEEFKKKFRESNVPESIMELKRREFENLAQNDKPIMKSRSLLFYLVMLLMT
jgi:hypothetical protein